MNITCDVAIVGGGASGIALAAAVQERDLKTVVIEKSSKIGGPVNGGNGLFAIQSRQQKKAGVTYTHKDVFDFLMQHGHYRTDAGLVSSFVNNCTPALEWLERLGVKFGLCPEENSIHFRSWHTLSRPGPSITEALEQSFRANGGEVLNNCLVQSLTTTNGAVTGVRGRKADGEEVIVQSRAVVLATGGCAGNSEMIIEYTPFLPGKTIIMENIGTEDGPSSRGEGLKLAWSVGAKKGEIVMDTYLCMPPPYGGGGGMCPELRLFHDPQLMVNCKGERVINEEIIVNGAFAGNVAIRQPDGTIYMIVTDEMAAAYEEDCRLNPPMTPFGPAPECTPFREFFHDAVENKNADCLFIADSVEELAAKIGSEPKALEETIVKYNAECEAGVDNSFYKSSEYMKPLHGSRFYACKFLVASYGSLGGIVINAKGQVLNDNRDAIPGLYCNGMDANSINAGSYTHQMSGSSSAFYYAMALVEAEALAQELL